MADFTKGSFMDLVSNGGLLDYLSGKIGPTSAPAGQVPGVGNMYGNHPAQGGAVPAPVVAPSDIQGLFSKLNPSVPGIIPVSKPSMYGDKVYLGSTDAVNAPSDSIRTYKGGGRETVPSPGYISDNELFMNKVRNMEEYVEPVSESKPKPKAKAKTKKRVRVRSKKRTPAVSPVVDAIQRTTNSSAGVPGMSNADRLAMLRYDGDQIVY